jgi:protein ImuB
MPKRFVSIWFRYLLTDRLAIRRKELKGMPFVYAEPQRGRKVITAMTAAAAKYGVVEGMTVADAKVTVPDLLVFDGKPGRNEVLLKGLAEWFLRYTPYVAVDLPDGLLLDVTGCTHLRGGECQYLKYIVDRLNELGYNVRPGMADTIGCAWGVARWADKGLIVAPGEHRNALMCLPPSALRLPADLLVKLDNLGLHTIGSFIHMPKAVIRRRFGKDMVLRLYQALGQEEEFLLPLKEPVPYSERLPFLEPIRTRPVIETALKTVLDNLCRRLHGEGRGLRSAILTYYRIDGKKGSLEVGTNQATYHSSHLFKLFSLKLDIVAPGLGIELFVLEAPVTEAVCDKQADLWATKPGQGSEEVTELLDRLAVRVGTGNIRRYLPAEHFWPERASEPTGSVNKKPTCEWRTDKPRPMQLLDPPQPIAAMARTPDYPLKQFIYRGQRHIIVHTDGPERIGREWWLDQGESRDYYIVEDESGRRYWVFRPGLYDADQQQYWYLHGFFA